MLLATLAYGVVRIIQHRERKFEKCGYVPGYVNPYPDKTLTAHDTSNATDIFFACSKGITRYKKLRSPYNNEAVLNSEGFRSPEFVPRQFRQRDKVCVGLIGDSFTFGCSAKPLHQCFADQLRTKTKLRIDNMGVEGADMCQYALLTAWYAENYQPDIIYIILSKGDYDTDMEREPAPYKAMYFVTEQGTAYPQFDVCGKFNFPTLEASRDYYKQHYTMLANKDVFSGFLSQTNVGTQFWKKYFWQNPEDACPRKPMTGRYLKKIDSLCVAHDILWMPLIIPGRDDPFARDSLQLATYYHSYMLDFNFLFPRLKRSDYADGADTHINSAGHAIVARILEQDIERKCRQLFPVQSAMQK